MYVLYIQCDTVRGDVADSQTSSEMFPSFLTSAGKEAARPSKAPRCYTDTSRSLLPLASRLGASEVSRSGAQVLPPSTHAARRFPARPPRSCNCALPAVDLGVRRAERPSRGTYLHLTTSTTFC